MNLSDLLRRQWQDYAKAHHSRLNLSIHLVAVPAFIVATLMFFFALINLNVVGVVLSTVAVTLAFGMQGLGHAKEGVAAEPFSGPGQAIVRILLEQFVTFPRFVLTGGWYVAFRYQIQT